jgi:hypothetical protein
MKLDQKVNANLNNEPRIKNHVEYPNNKDACNDHEFDALIGFHEKGSLL